MLKLLLLLPLLAQAAKTEHATFAGGCFWSMQKAFDELKDRGVVSTAAGYSGGAKAHPTYDEVSTGTTGHRESVDIVFDPAKITYAELLNVYWHHIDPMDSKGQFCDDGDEYRSAIFPHGDEQKKAAEASMKEVGKKLKAPVATQILPAKEFYAAEDYHQHYATKNPARYNAYRIGCGRDKRMKEVWGDK